MLNLLFNRNSDETDVNLTSGTRVALPLLKFLAVCGACISFGILLARWWTVPQRLVNLEKMVAALTLNTHRQCLLIAERFGKDAKLECKTPPLEMLINGVVYNIHAQQ